MESLTLRKLNDRGDEARALDRFGGFGHSFFGGVLKPNVNSFLKRAVTIQMGGVINITKHLHHLDQSRIHQYKNIYIYIILYDIDS